ncbi:MAG: fused MFS/spermidine synthase [Gemmatimonadetes bacterium]|nr:fused MFS/spermidine synthase [Gemmatimonadota bacterium]NNL29524.1 fused MFS/spermidine synthase [Gemmatimonadota bacterium]
MSRRSGLFALAFGSGFAVLAIEIAGARLIAPVFGLSAVPWTAVIGVILTALALGNHFGGRLADAGKVPLSRILVVAGFTGLLPVLGAGVPWVARSVLGFIPGAVVSALVLFAPPVLCLGAVVPYLVRADTESLETIGRRAGDISAAATTGSIAGSFVTGFFLLPAMPLPVLLGLTAGALFVMAWAASRILGEGGFGGGVLMAALVGPAVGLLASGTPPDTLHAEQTLHTSVRVTERTWADGSRVRELWQNGGSSSAEYVASGAPAHVYARASLEIVRPFVAEMEQVLVLGGAALTLPVALVAESDDLRVDVVEIDPEVTRLAEAYFTYGEAPRPAIDVIHEDGRVFLRAPARYLGRAAGDPETRASGAGAPQYDLIYLDVFDHLLTVPWTMVTREALADMAALLDEDGIFMANVLSPLEGEGRVFLQRLRATLESVFGDVRVYLADPTLDAGATQNLVVLATVDPSLLPPLDRPQTSVTGEGRPFTDAWAPVEYLQAKVFLEGLRWR